MHEVDVIVSCNLQASCAGRQVGPVNGSRARRHRWNAELALNVYVYDYIAAPYCNHQTNT